MDSHYHFKQMLRLNETIQAHGVAPRSCFTLFPSCRSKYLSLSRPQCRFPKLHYYKQQSITKPIPCANPTLRRQIRKGRSPMTPKRRIRWILLREGKAMRFCAWKSNNSMAFAKLSAQGRLRLPPSQHRLPPSRIYGNFLCHLLM